MELLLLLLYAGAYQRNKFAWLVLESSNVVSTNVRQGS